MSSPGGGASTGFAQTPSPGGMKISMNFDYISNAILGCEVNKSQKQTDGRIDNHHLWILPMTSLRQGRRQDLKTHPRKVGGGKDITTPLPGVSTGFKDTAPIASS